MNGNKRLVHNVLRGVKHLFMSPSLTSLIVLLILTPFIIYASYQYYITDWDGFKQNVLVEAHGMLMDVVIFGLLLVYIDKKRQKYIEIERNKEIICDFQTWHSEESAFRVYGAYKRLYRSGIKINLEYAWLAGLRTSDADFSQVELTGAYFDNATLVDADFRFSYLKRATLHHADCWGADFRGAHLYDSDFQHCNLGQANFSSMIVQRVNFKGADLENADFTDCMLSELDLRETNVYQAKLTGAKYLKVLFPVEFDPEEQGLVELDQSSWDLAGKDLVQKQVKNRKSILNEPISLREKVNRTTRYNPDMNFLSVKCE